MLLLRESNTIRCDMKETKDDYVLKLDLPGYQKENIKIMLEDGYLKVTASQEKESEQEEKYIIRERFHGELARSFYLGKGINQEEITANYEHGVLKIKLAKLSKREIEEKGRILIA